MAQFSIRPARPEDCGTILELIRGIAEYEKMSDEVVATEETIRHAMFDEHVTRCLLAELDGKVIGYALYFYNYSTFIGTKGLYLEDLFLYPEYRKAGYGKRLIRELFKIAAAENCGRMEWCCLNWNTPSQEFYKSLGAKPVWRRSKAVRPKRKAKRPAPVHPGAGRCISAVMDVHRWGRRAAPA